jgi:hypothetical protein
MNLDSCYSSPYSGFFSEKINLLYGFFSGNRNLLYSINRILIRKQKYALRNPDSFQEQILLPKNPDFSQGEQYDLIFRAKKSFHFDLDFLGGTDISSP